MRVTGGRHRRGSAPMFIKGTDLRHDKSDMQLHLLRARADWTRLSWKAVRLLFISKQLSVLNVFGASLRSHEALVLVPAILGVREAACKCPHFPVGENSESWT